MGKGDFFQEQGARRGCILLPGNPSTHAESSVLHSYPAAE